MDLNTAPRRQNSRLAWFTLSFKKEVLHRETINFFKNFQNHRYTYEYMLYIEYGCVYSNLVKSYSPLKFVEDYVTENH